AAVVLTPSKRARVLLVAPARADGGDEAASDLFLAQVLNSAVESGLLRSVRTVSGARYRGMMGAGAGDGGGAPEFDLAVFDRVSPDALPGAPSISFGAGLPLPGLIVDESEPDGPAGAAHLVSWRRTHPLLRYVSLDQVLIAKAARLRLVED